MSARTTRLYLVRHGEVASSWHGRIYGALDVPLSPRGMREGERVARTLEHVDLAAVVSSGLVRTEQAAARLRALRALERIDDPDLRELERGAWAGLALSELEALQPGAWSAWTRSPASSRPPAGESLTDLLARVRPRIEHWASAFPNRSIALVTHGWVVRVLVCHVLGASLDLAPRIDVRTGDIALLRWPTTPPRAAPELEAFALDQPGRQLSE
jgi:broad specificity phosphatase PhoE